MLFSPKRTASKVQHRADSFTIVELLTVIFIISLLAALTLAAATSLWNKAARSRAASEIQAMSTALEGYKTDNGIYPQSPGTMLTNTAADLYNASTQDGTSANYRASSKVVYSSLSGQVNFTDVPTTGTKVYMAFKANQVGDPTGTATGATYVKDPWNYSYGYSTGSTNGAPTPSYPLNGNLFFDLWSTGGLTGTKNTNTAVWISNWQ